MMTMNQLFPKEETHFSCYCCFYAPSDWTAEAPARSLCQGSPNIFHDGKWEALPQAKRMGIPARHGPGTTNMRILISQIYIILPISMFKYNTQTLFISTLKNKYVQEAKCFSLHTLLFLESTRHGFWSSWGFLRGCHRSLDTSSELPCVDGSHGLTHTMFSERVIWNWDGNFAPGHETKGQ